jgi:hypothetical protein
LKSLEIAKGLPDDARADVLKQAAAHGKPATASAALDMAASLSPELAREILLEGIKREEWSFRESVFYAADRIDPKLAEEIAAGELKRRHTLFYKPSIIFEKDGNENAEQAAKKRVISRLLEMDTPSGIWLAMAWTKAFPLSLKIKILEKGVAHPDDNIALWAVENMQDADPEIRTKLMESALERKYIILQGGSYIGYHVIKGVKDLEDQLKMKVLIKGVQLRTSMNGLAFDIPKYSLDMAKEIKTPECLFFVLEKALENPEYLVALQAVYMAKDLPPEMKAKVLEKAARHADDDVVSRAIKHADELDPELKATVL